MKIEKSKMGNFTFYPLSQLKEMGFNIDKYPYSIKILIENVLRNMDGEKITEDDLESIASWKVGKDFAFMPTRVIMQDYTGVPLLVDLAAMRSELERRGKDPSRINPKIPSDLVIDHSIQVDYFGTEYSLLLNMKKEFERNLERYKFLKWAQGAFTNLRVVPPGHGIIHQVNLEFLSKVVDVREHNGVLTAFPEVVIGTDSHTTMADGVGILAWGVGGLEAEAVMLGEPYFMTVPEVVGVKLTGEIREGVTPTDVVLYITETLRRKGVVGKFVEFFGPSLSYLSVPDRATIGNMAPEYGATVGYFPIDEKTLYYLKATARDQDIVGEYAKAQGIYYSSEPNYTEVVNVDLGDVEPALAGPMNPDERVPLRKMWEVKVGNKKGKRVSDGSVVLASITSCTNTSNPTVMLGAGVLARKAVAYGLRSKDYVKTSMAPGSPIVFKYLEEAQLLPYLEALGFHVVGFGCTTCIGNAGPLPREIEEDLKNGIEGYAVISGNRNFEGRINPLLKGTYLASPLLVVAYALAGRININFETDPLGLDPNGKPVFLKDIWPSMKEISRYMDLALNPKFYEENKSTIFQGDENWRSLEVAEGVTYAWDANSTYIIEPPWFKEDFEFKEIKDARILLILGDKVTTDHISPAGPIARDSEAGTYLLQKGVADLNTYGARRGNHEVMLRGGFANSKLRNKMVNRSGGFTKHYPDGEEGTVFSVAMKYRKEGVPLVIFAGKQYGTGSSRDWAAKVTALLGVRAVIAESFERIHRSNLVAMGVIPVEANWSSLQLRGDEMVSLKLQELKPRTEVEIIIKGDSQQKLHGVARIDTKAELEYIKNGNILNYVFKRV
ncbi:aconitate hydratase AcnA [Metallosphaera tengchongensis]|uniref:Aconitate hydratase AcnA n=1 Tax=Metallosphaera tengchongensis TaxID=1532350 RepID=A0A6N0NQJ6_9CREN|nr:aconitate hydratase AcnA [Metallosphaera tengchongensis]QKQ99143.1 aconitate hydratase AcnA [Metallosphaera tengchongensis]